MRPCVSVYAFILFGLCLSLSFSSCISLALFACPCLSVNDYTKSFSTKKPVVLKQNFNLFFSKTCCVKVGVFSAWKSKHSNVGKANCRGTIQGYLVWVFLRKKRIVT